MAGWHLLKGDMTKAQFGAIVRRLQLIPEMWGPVCGACQDHAVYFLLLVGLELNLQSSRMDILI
jgi:hypothetical protein